MKVKKAKTAFTRDDLPKNRWEVFGDCLKERFLLFVYIGLALLIFALPLFFVTVMSDNTSTALYHTFVNAEYTREEYAALVQSARSMYSLFFIPCYTVLAAGAAGVMQIIRQLVWGEGVFFMQDMIEGIKTNGLYYALIAFLTGGAAYLQVTFLPIESNKYYVVIPIIASLIFLPPFCFMLSQIVVYKNPFLKYLKNGFLLYIKTVPTTLVFLALFCIPAAIGLNLLPFLAKYIILTAFFLILAPMLLTGWFLYSCHVFDKFVNKQAYPEIYDKGVYRKIKEKE